jgi:uncharacterized protein
VYNFQPKRLENIGPVMTTIRCNAKDYRVRDRLCIGRSLFLLLIACASLNAATIPSVPSQYFNDYVGVIAPLSIAYFNDVLARFERETSNQINVAFFSKLDPDVTIEQFGEEAFRAWKPGQAGRNNGVLVLVFVDDRKVRIQTGLGLEKALPDKVCGEIIARDIAPNFRKGDYNGGIEAALNSIMNDTRDTYNGYGQTAAEKRRERQQHPTLGTPQP